MTKAYKYSLFVIVGLVLPYIALNQKLISEFPAKILMLSTVFLISIIGVLIWLMTRDAHKQNIK